jgi:hypothetical protein
MALKVGYVPEHFSTPLFLAEKHGFYDKHDVKLQFLPYPSGSGHMIQSLKDGTIGKCESGKSLKEVNSLTLIYRCCNWFD